MPKVIVANCAEETPNYIRCLKHVGLEPVNMTELPESIDEYAALLLPGGDDVDPALFHRENCGSRTIDRKLDDFQLGIMDMFVKAGKPVIGICKGCQVINVYFGGTLIQDLPDGTRERHTYHNGTGEIHTTRVDRHSFLYKLYLGRGLNEEGYMTTNSFHHQAVEEVGQGLNVIQYSDDGVIEGMVHETLPVIALQWHPEKMAYETVREDVVDGAPVFEYFRSLAMKY